MRQGIFEKLFLLNMAERPLKILNVCKFLRNEKNSKSLRVENTNITEKRVTTKVSHTNSRNDTRMQLF